MEQSKWRRTASENIHFYLDRPERGEEQEILQGNSDEWYAPSHHQEDSTRDKEEAKNDLWTITGEFIHRHHVVTRAKLHAPKEESFPIPLKCRRYQNDSNFHGCVVGETS